MKQAKRAPTILLLMLFFYAHTLYSQAFQYTPLCIEAQEQIVKFNLRDAAILLEKEKKQHAENATVALLENYIDFYTFIATQDVNWLKQKQGILDERIKKINACKLQSPHIRYAKSEIYLQWAFCQAISGELTSAAINFRNAYKQLDENIKQYPAFAPNLKNMGMLKAMLGTTPDNYKWMLKIVGMEGDFKGGMLLLENFITNTHQNPSEPLDKQTGNYYYILLNLNFGNRTECWQYTDQYTRTNQNNPLNIYLRAFTAIKSARSEEAIKTLRNRAAQSDISFPMFDYLMGVAMLNALNSDAPIYLKKFVSFSKGGNLIKDAYMRLALHYYLNNEVGEAALYRKMALQYGNSFTDEDKKALKECSQNDWPHAQLLRIRLLQDGGYYKHALAIADQIQPQTLTEEQLAEYHYRIARIQHEQQQYLKAIENYKQAIRISKNMQIHYAPFSNFYIGSIYEQIQSKELARTYYQRVFEYKNFPYKTSIFQKARAGLSRLE